MAESKIEWTEYSWNPVTGCDPDDGFQSEACINCYARRIARRLKGRFSYPKNEPFSVTIHRNRSTEPLKIKKPHRIFTCSMGDLFHICVPMYVIAETFEIMRAAKQHQFIVLTKRPHRALQFCRNYSSHPDIEDPSQVWPDNVIAMITAENQQRADERIPLLLQIPAKIKGVSIEPMLGPINIKGYLMEGKAPGFCGNCKDIHGFTRCPNYGGISKTNDRRGCENFKRVYFAINLVIVGGETGPGARPMHPNWVRKIQDDCQVSDVSFFFKSWGDWVTEDQSPEDIILPGTSHYPKGWSIKGPSVYKVGKKKAGRLLDGHEWSEWPETR